MVDILFHTGSSYNMDSMLKNGLLRGGPQGDRKDIYLSTVHARTPSLGREVYERAFTEVTLEPYPYDRKHNNMMVFIDIALHTGWVANCIKHRPFVLIVRLTSHQSASCAVGILTPVATLVLLPGLKLSRS